MPPTASAAWPLPPDPPNPWPSVQAWGHQSAGITLLHPIRFRSGLTCLLPGGFEFECDGYVRFVRDPLDFASESEPGIGIQFEGLPDDARNLVLRFIGKRPPIFYDV